jgi:hypothetical protein
MADAVDMASEIEGEHLARALQRAVVPIPVGAPGECENCGDDTPRLVGGWCAFCRDGRRRVPGQGTPRAFDPRPRPVPVPPPSPASPPIPKEEPPIMAAPDRRQISFVAEGDVRRAIEGRADANDISLGRAALDLVEHGILSIARPVAPEATLPTEAAIEGAIDPATLSPLQRAWIDDGGSLDQWLTRMIGNDDLAVELSKRAQVAEAERDVAEAKLARLRDALA